MQILPNHYYIVIMRVEEVERVGRCFGLVVQELSPEQLSASVIANGEKEKQPTHGFVFRDPQYFRSYTGRIKEDTAERLVFSLGGGKEYEFRPIISSSEPSNSGKGDGAEKTAQVV